MNAVLILEQCLFGDTQHRLLRAGSSKVNVPVTEKNARGIRRPLAVSRSSHWEKKKKGCNPIVPLSTNIVSMERIQLGRKQLLNILQFH